MFSKEQRFSATTIVTAGILGALKMQTRPLATGWLWGKAPHIRSVLKAGDAVNTLHMKTRSFLFLILSSMVSF